jgi:hypothetical protein
MITIDIAHSKGWNIFWIDTDSLMVTLTFKISFIIPWQLKNCWLNCIELTKKNLFTISYICREDNQYGDDIVNLEFQLHNSHWWDKIVAGRLQLHDSHW